MQNIEYNNAKVEGHKLEIQEILSTLNAPSPPPDGTLDVGERVTDLAPADPHHISTTFVSESGTFLPLSSQTWHRVLIAPHFSASIPVCGRLIRRAFALHELPSLIEAIFASKDEVDAIRCLFGDDAQTFIDVVDEVRSTLVLKLTLIRSARHWIGLIFRRQPERSASNYCTGHAVTTHSFREP